MNRTMLQFGSMFLFGGILLLWVSHGQAVIALIMIPFGLWCFGYEIVDYFKSKNRRSIR